MASQCPPVKIQEIGDGPACNFLHFGRFCFSFFGGGAFHAVPNNIGGESVRFVWRGSSSPWFVSSAPPLAGGLWGRRCAGAGGTDPRLLLPPRKKFHHRSQSAPARSGRVAIVGGVVVDTHVSPPSGQQAIPAIPPQKNAAGVVGVGPLTGSLPWEESK